MTLKEGNDEKRLDSYVYRCIQVQKWREERDRFLKTATWALAGRWVWRVEELYQRDDQSDLGL